MKFPHPFSRLKLIKNKILDLWLGRYRRMIKDYEFLTRTIESSCIRPMSRLMLKRDVERSKGVSLLPKNSMRPTAKGENEILIRRLLPQIGCISEK